MVVHSSSSTHRPWPTPNKPWVMKQTWNDLLFAHWPIDADLLRALIPNLLPVDTYEGTAWIAVVPFWMSGVTARGIPPLPYFSQFPEMNLRTYVTLEGKPGVCFFSLDADNRFAVEAARAGFHLPYFHADIHVKNEHGTIHYESLRTDKRAEAAEFRACYRPNSEVYTTAPGTLEHWLTERYCLYAIDKKKRIYRGEIDHCPWPLQKAEADIWINTVPQSFGIPIPDQPPLLHFAKKLDVRIWLLEQIKKP
jgi:uncharacterized protein YqjF (DUF2071 family)